MRDSILMRNHNRSIRAELLMKARASTSSARLRRSKGARAIGRATLASTTARRCRPKSRAATSRADRRGSDLHAGHDGRDGHPRSLARNAVERDIGRAIRARQHEGDVATIIYHDNMLAAQQEAGEVINELIPTVFDTARTIRTVGPTSPPRWSASTTPSNRSRKHRPRLRQV
jgi:hypothetical protein